MNFEETLRLKKIGTRALLESAAASVLAATAVDDGPLSEGYAHRGNEACVRPF